SNILHSLEKVHERQLRVHFSPTRGLHHHFDVFFDYFHLCAVEMAIHGALTNITPSVIRVALRTVTLIELAEVGHESLSQLSLVLRTTCDLPSSTQFKCDSTCQMAVITTLSVSLKLGFNLSSFSVNHAGGPGDNLVPCRNARVSQCGFVSPRLLSNSNLLKTNGSALTGANPVAGKQVAAVLVEPPLLWERTSTRRVVPESIRGSYIDPGSSTPNLVPEKACSKTLLIMYREESTKLCDVFEQRVLFPVDPCNLEESLIKHELLLCVELWFAEEGVDESNILHSLEKVHERQLRVHFSPTRGLHHHFDVFFDYFHLCAVEMAIHGALTNITPSVISPPKQSPRATPIQNSVSQLNLTQQSWHSILFSMRNHTSRVQLAFAVHRHLCHALLAARESMLLFWREVLPYLSANTKPRMGEYG
ncbi:hypothetical protein AHF37_10291, partial [Paragonimus kellicotti]